MLSRSLLVEAWRRREPHKIRARRTGRDSDNALHRESRMYSQGDVTCIDKEDAKKHVIEAHLFIC